MCTLFSQSETIRVSAKFCEVLKGKTGKARWFQIVFVCDLFCLMKKEKSASKAVCLINQDSISKAKLSALSLLLQITLGSKLKEDQHLEVHGTEC